VNLTDQAREWAIAHLRTVRQALPDCPRRRSLDAEIRSIRRGEADEGLVAQYLQEAKPSRWQRFKQRVKQAMKGKRDGGGK